MVLGTPMERHVWPLALGRDGHSLGNESYDRSDSRPALSVIAARNAEEITETLSVSRSIQQQLAEILGIAQQTMAHYEGGRQRIAVALLSGPAPGLGGVGRGSCQRRPQGG